MTREEVLARKQEARRERAGLSFGQKVAILEKMREGFAPFAALRAKHQQERVAKRSRANSG